ncbi:MAG: aldolase/citrate lyase family protein [Terriglobales bacterium]
MSSAAEITAASRSGQAGHWGKEVRSDAHVTFEARDSGGIEISLESRVAPYYGDAILKQSREVLAELGIKHARVAIHDEGALPFTIGARIEAAAKRAGAAQGKRWLPEPHSLAAPSPKSRLRRSRLYLPGSEPKYFINAALHEPDAIILDLEDSVHRDEKDAARILVRNTLRAVDFGACERMVRINQLPLGLEDLAEVISQSPDLILIPKVERAEQVAEVDREIGEIKTREEIPRPTWLMPILESALGIENAFAVASASPNVAALTIGLEDYTADLGVVKTSEGRESQYARARVVNAAHAAGVQAIDSVFGDVGEMDGLLRWGQASRAMGFEGMGCLHPGQIRMIHEAFRPTAAEIEKAQRIVAAFEEAQRKGLAVVSLGSKMIDPPVVQRALKLVERAKTMGVIS